MKKMVRTLLCSVVVVSALALLTGCDFFKPATCPTCKPVEVAPPVNPEDVLLTIDGTPAITKEQFEDFYEVARGQAGPYGALSKKDAFDMMVKMEVLDRKIMKDGKDRSKQYKKDFVRAYNVARWGVNSQILAKELQDTIDISERALDKFYQEQRAKKNQAFDRPPFVKSPESIGLRSVEFADKASAEAFLKKAKTDFEASASAEGLSVKDLGQVSQQSQDVDFSIRLKARSIKPNGVELVQAGDKFFVIKAGHRTKAQYADFSEIKALPQMKEMLGQFKKQMELEPAFIKRVEEYKKGFNIVENLKYFEEAEAQQEAEEAKIKELLAQQMKKKDTKKEPAKKGPAKKPAPSPVKPSGVVAG